MLFQKNNEENRPANQARNGYLIANDEKMRESESCSSVHEKVKKARLNCTREKEIHFYFV